MVGGWGVDKLGTFDWGGGKLSESEREEDKLQGWPGTVELTLRNRKGKMEPLSIQLAEKVGENPNLKVPASLQSTY